MAGQGQSKEMNMKEARKVAEGNSVLKDTEDWLGHLCYYSHKTEDGVICTKQGYIPFIGDMDTPFTPTTCSCKALQSEYCEEFAQLIEVLADAMCTPEVRDEIRNTVETARILHNHKGRVVGSLTVH